MSSALEVALSSTPADAAAVPELDVRVIPHAIRHASVLGAFDALLPGQSLVLIAPHDPLPLLRQLTERAGGRLDVEYLEQGPQAWKLKLTSTHSGT